MYIKHLQDRKRICQYFVDKMYSLLLEFHLILDLLAINFATTSSQ